MVKKDNKKMKVLSLFDGISCGMVALERAGIPVDRYLAYEIEPAAIKVSGHNHPDIEQRGDVFNGDFTEFRGFDLLIGGSPCSWWSNARANRTDKETSPDGIGYKLFCEYVRALKESGAKYFLYENNNSISKEIKDQITKDLGVKPILINSSLVSAQNRKRCYWTNISNVIQPQDKKILLSDVIEGAVNGAAYRNQVQRDGSLKACTNVRKDGKSNCLIAYMANKNCCVQMKDGTIRPLTAEEFEILQTLPVGYTSCLPESKRKTVIGLGWTVDVIAHIFRGLNV